MQTRRKKWAVAKIIGHDVPEAWYKKLVGKKVRIRIDDNGNPVAGYLVNYKYYYEYNTRNLINSEDLVFVQ